MPTGRRDVGQDDPAVSDVLHDLGNDRIALAHEVDAERRERSAVRGEARDGRAEDTIPNRVKAFVEAHRHKDLVRVRKRRE